MNKNRLRYRQRYYHLYDIDDLNLNWNIEKYGCGSAAIANVLINYDFNYNPLDIS